MKKNVLSLLFLLILLTVTALPLSAAELPDNTPTLSLYPYICDNADVLDDDAEELLYRRAVDIAQAYDVDVLILTVTSLEGLSEDAYASRYYDENGFGRENGGFLFLVDTQNRYYYLLADGEVYRSLGERYLDSLDSAVFPYLSDSNYDGAFSAYYDHVSARLAKGLEAPDIELSDLLVPFLVILGISLLIALIVTQSMKAKMKTARSQRAANSYVREGSFVVREQADLFLYRTRTRTRIRSSSGGSRSGGGGGGSRGGRGGRF